MTDLTAIRDRLHHVLGTDFGVAAADPTQVGPALFAEEEDAIARAVPKRRLEFSAGRTAARAAMAQIDLPPAAILKAQDRSPVWPDGLIGSITHCNDICLAVVARADATRGIGIDIEPNTALSPDLEEVVCTPDERAWLDQQPSDQRGALAKCYFCAKESAYKAVYPLIGKVFGFFDMRIVFNSDGTGFEARTAGMPPLTGQVIRFPHHLVCITVIAADG